MKKMLIHAGLVAAMAAFPSVAYAQQAEPFVGVSVGTHDLGVNVDLDDVEIDDSGVIYGVVGGVDFPLTDTVFAGVEGNFHLGSSSIDHEFGGSARLGIKVADGGKLYVRGGYQQVNVDTANFFGLEGPAVGNREFDDTDGDYLVGVGADFFAGPGAIRLNVDTISFDTVRLTTGYVINF